MDKLSRLTVARNLQKQIQSLIERLCSLATVAQDRIVNPLSRGETPDLAILDNVRAAMAETEAAFSKAVELGIGYQATLKLPELLERLNRIIKDESWTTIQEECLPDLERILRIVHKSGQTPPFLQELQERARRYVQELTTPTPLPETTPEAWETKVRPFRYLWLFLNEPDALSDLQAEEALTLLEQQFSRSLVSAITLRRLLVQPEIPPPPKGDADQSKFRSHARCAPSGRSTQA